VIPEPQPPEPKFGPKGPDGVPMQLPAGPPPPPEKPTVAYCNGMDCPWDDGGEGVMEHMHQWCDCCGYEWLSEPLGYAGP
jgi:hypothetical protein